MKKLNKTKRLKTQTKIKRSQKAQDFKCLSLDNLMGFTFYLFFVVLFLIFLCELLRRI